MSFNSPSFGASKKRIEQAVRPTDAQVKNTIQELAQTEPDLFQSYDDTEIKQQIAQQSEEIVQQVSDIKKDFESLDEGFDSRVNLILSEKNLDDVAGTVNELLDESLLNKLEIHSTDIVSDNLYVIETSTDNSYIEKGNSEPTVNQYSGLWSVTDFIDVSEYEELVYSGLTNVGTAPYSAFYDSEKRLLSSFKHSTGNNIKITIPYGAKYIRFSVFIVDKPNFIVKGKSKGRFAELIANITAPMCDLNDTQLWEQGVITGNGNNASENSAIHTKRIRTKTYIPSNVERIRIDKSYKFALCCYDGINSVYNKNGSKCCYYTFTDSNIIGNNFSADVVYTQNEIVLEDIKPFLGNYTNIRLIVAEVSGEEIVTVNNCNVVELFGTKKDEKEEIYLVEQNGALIRNGIDSSNNIWNQWDARLAFGMNTSDANIPVKIDGQMFVDGTMITRNSADKNKNRWGFHVYEAYAKDNYSRMTMLLDKHTEFSKKCFEMYYYTGANHFAPSYGWTRVGSDVTNHSFMFDRDTMLALGVIDARNIINLARISPTNDLDKTCSTVAEADAKYEPDAKGIENSKCLLYLALKNADNGAMFYDTDRNKVVCKIDGKWCDIGYTDASDLYDF